MPSRRLCAKAKCRGYTVSVHQSKSRFEWTTAFFQGCRHLIDGQLRRCVGVVESGGRRVTWLNIVMPISRESEEGKCRW